MTAPAPADENLSVTEFNKNISVYLAQAAAGEPVHIGYGRGRHDYTSLIPTEALKRFALELGEDRVHEIFQECGALADPTQLTILAARRTARHRDRKARRQEVA